MFVSTVNSFRKIFYTTGRVWVVPEFPLTVNHAPKPCKIFYTCIFPTIDFHPRKIEEREKQQNRRELRSHIQAPTSRTPAPPRSSPPKTDPPKTDLVLDPKLICATVLAIVLDYRSISLSLDRWIWWIFFFLLGFVSFVFIYWEMILYICLEAEKMWVTSKKCVFYSIFKNTTKH